MRRVLASGLLALFVFSTAATYASVHHCKGELTDVALLYSASCDHDDAAVHHHQEDHAKKGCCKKSEESQELQVDPCCQSDGCDDKEEDDCCDTEELTAVKSILTKAESNSNQKLVKIHPSFYDFYFENAKILKRTYGVAYTSPPLKRNICIEVQCFRI